MNFRIKSNYDFYSPYMQNKTQFPIYFFYEEHLYDYNSRLFVFLVARFQAFSALYALT